MLKALNLTHLPLLVAFVIFLSLCLPVKAIPSPVDSMVITSSNIDHFQPILDHVEVSVDPRELESEGLVHLPYSLAAMHGLQKAIATSAVDQFIYLRFSIRNPTDSSMKLIFFPGIYFDPVALFEEIRPEEIVPLNNDTKKFNDQKAYFLFEVGANQQHVFYARVKSIRSNTSLLRPVLIRAEDINAWNSYYHNLDMPIKNFSYMVVGMLLVMIFYATIHFLQTYSRQFLYYQLYAISMGLMFFLYAQENRDSVYFNFFFEEYLDFFLQLTAYFFYFIFLRYFLETRQKYKRLDKLCEYSQYLILICLGLYSYFYFSGGNFVALNTIENFSKYFLIAFGLAIVVKGLRHRDLVFKYVMSGNLMLILFSSFSLIMLVLNWKPFGVSSLFNRSLFYYEAGVAAELVFFLLGLSFKNRKELVQRTAEKEKLKLENRRKEFEKQIAILQAQQEERNRISRDIHDELGGGMTAIRLMSELAKERMKTQQIPEIEKISASANDLLTKMNAIVWSMSHSNDSVSNLVAYIRNYAMEFFENTPIECRVDAPQEIPSLEMSGEKRRNIFLSLKETLNNTLKHSGASKVNIRIHVNHKLEICVHDNGRGFNVEKTRQFGTGLQNIKKRMDSIYGNFSVESKEGAYTLLAVDIN